MRPELTTGDCLGSNLTPLIRFVLATLTAHKTCFELASLEMVGGVVLKLGGFPNPAQLGFPVTAVVLSPSGDVDGTSEVEGSCGLNAKPTSWFAEFETAQITSPVASEAAEHPGLPRNDVPE
jgi:hypothetical protein